MSRRTCAHPGCDRVLYPCNRNGVCRGHNHGPACGCAGCCAKRGDPAHQATRDAPGQLCAHPGCDKRLSGKGRSGLCRQHSIEATRGRPRPQKPPLPADGTAGDVAANEAARAIEPDAAACRALWVTVLHAVLEDIAATAAGRGGPAGVPRSLMASPAFIGSRDFHQLAALCGLDGQAVRDAVLAGRFRAGLSVHYVTDARGRDERGA